EHESYSHEAVPPVRGKPTKRRTLMKRLVIGSALTVVALWAGIAALRADDSNKENSLQARLIGTWRLSSAKWGGQQSDFPKTSPTLKHVTPAGFMWVSYDPDTKKIT